MDKKKLIKCIVPIPKPVTDAITIPKPSLNLDSTYTSKLKFTQPSTYGCTYKISPSTIPLFISSANPGDVACVTDGILKAPVDITRSGSSSKWITLKAFPGARPIIDNQNKDTNRVTLNASNWIIEGFEIRNGYDGVKVYKPHNIIRNNWIHHNKFQGILIVSTSDILVENNKIEYNGTTGYCAMSGWGDYPKLSQLHCHGVYISNFQSTCLNMGNIRILNNIIANEPGGGVSFNGSLCAGTWIDGVDILNNKFIDNASGIRVYHNAKNINISGNKFVVSKYPETDMPKGTFSCVITWGDNSIVDLRQNNYNIRLPSYTQRTVITD